MKNDFWRNKRVLITGYEGFLGSNLTKTLINGQADITALDIETYRKDTVLTENDYKRIKVVNGSVADYNLIAELISVNKIEYIFHLAAEALVGNCYQQPLRGFSFNIEGTWKLLEACRTVPGVKAMVVASSDKAYGSHQQLPYTEAAPLIGKHPYDVSKSCADLIAYTYYYTYKVPVAITRCGNIYGPGEFSFSRIVPETIRCALADETLAIRSDGTFTRDYVYVDDIVSGYLSLAEQLQEKNLAGEAFNFSDENPLTVLQLVESLYRVLDKKSNYKILDQAPYEIKHQYLDSSKARNILGWRPQYSLTEGLQKTIDWYRAYFKEKGLVSVVSGQEPATV